MLQIPCPHCGLRSEHEFVCAGQVSQRPPQPEALDEAAWADLLYQRDNPDEPVLEHWWHGHGCRSWLWVRRDPHTQQMVAVHVAGPDA